MSILAKEKPHKIKKSIGSKLFDTFNIIFLILLGLSTLYPFWDCMVVSCSSLKSYLNSTVHLWPQEWSFEGYQYIMQKK